MPQYYDSLEARDPEERERLLMAALPGQIAHAKRKAPGWARILADVDPAGVTSRATLAKLPVTRKSDLAKLQRAERPFGGLNATLAQLGKKFPTTRPATSARMNPRSLVSLSDQLMPNLCMSAGVVTAKFA